MPTCAQFVLVFAVALAGACYDAQEQADAHDATVGCLAEAPSASGIDEEQALCIAEADGLRQGIEGYTASREDVATLEGPVWLVMSTIYWEPHPCRKGGDACVIDATSGEVLQRNQWEQRCD